MTNSLNRIVKDAKLRRVAILEKDFQSAVAVKVCECERAAVFEEVQTCGAGNLREGAILVIHEHYIPRIPMPSVIRSDQFVDRIPAALVCRSRSGVF